jgi:hypothetical protein
LRLAPARKRTPQDAFLEPGGPQEQLHELQRLVSAFEVVRSLVQSGQCAELLIRAPPDDAREVEIDACGIAGAHGDGDAQRADAEDGSLGHVGLRDPLKGAQESGVDREQILGRLRDARRALVALGTGRRRDEPFLSPHVSRKGNDEEQGGHKPVIGGVTRRALAILQPGHVVDVETLPSAYSR